MNSQIEPNLVKLVAQTVEDIAKLKGLQAYPHEDEVRLVLVALAITNKAIERVKDETKRRK